MPRTASSLATADQAFLLALQQRALRYFLDNQTPSGLFLDRQRNFENRLGDGWCSTAASGMGLIALALATAEPFRLLTTREAAARVRRALTHALERVPETQGILPHFVDRVTGGAVGSDQRSTVDSAWLLAGGLWAAAFLEDQSLRHLAEQLMRRVDWRHWTSADGLLLHGADAQGNLLPCTWNRLNGETIVLYVLAAGSPSARPWPAANWQHLRPFFGTAAGLRFASADLGLFVFQYGLDLLDLGAWQEPGGIDLEREAEIATEANHRVCRDAADRFVTYRTYWGLSAGDGPGDAYRSYAPGEPLDGTAHLTASLASIARAPELVLENLHQGRHERRCHPLGRYGFSTINVDQHWTGRDMVGIDAGAALLALDNFLHENRIRSVFHSLPVAQAALHRLRFVYRAAQTAGARALPLAS